MYVCVCACVSVRVCACVTNRGSLLPSSWKANIFKVKRPFYVGRVVSSIFMFLFLFALNFFFSFCECHGKISITQSPSRSWANVYEITLSCCETSKPEYFVTVFFVSMDEYSFYHSYIR